MYKILLISLLLLAYSSKTSNQNAENNMENKSNLEYILLAGGCFWCVEAVFQNLNGVESVESGYCGGNTPNPSYEEVCSGETGYAEAVKIGFNPEIISLSDILEVFFATHDPTTLNRQGADIGTQYRSEIFYYNENQEKIIKNYIEFLEKEKVFDDKIVTKITSQSKFYKEENYHQNYYNNNKFQGYCRMVINPKLEKLKSKFSYKIKK